MSYNELVDKFIHEDGVEESTMMRTPCLRYRGDFMAMMFEKEEALIIKVSPKRVDELITEGKGLEFNFTKKKFKEWVLIPLDYENEYESLLLESLVYLKKKRKSKN
jgi:hypothetical protein